VIIDSIAAVVAGLKLYASDELSRYIKEHIAKFEQLITAYNALAPDWTQAPDGATHYVIHANGKAEWLKVIDSAAITIVPKNAAWSYEFVFWSQFVNYVDLPPGVDWKECCWPQPKEHTPQEITHDA
jgi:hypothetical protein